MIVFMESRKNHIYQKTVMLEVQKAEDGIVHEKETDEKEVQAATETATGNAPEAEAESAAAQNTTIASEIVDSAPASEHNRQHRHHPFKC